jgi:hypothetical protein
MVGTGAAEFSQNIAVSRGMLVTVLYRMAGEPPISALPSFSDVPGGDWYAAAVAWARANGIVSGVGNDLFALNAGITREQVAAILLNYARFAGVAPQGDWAVKGAMYAYMKDKVN